MSQIVKIFCPKSKHDTHMRSWPPIPSLGNGTETNYQVRIELSPVTAPFPPSAQTMHFPEVVHGW